MTNIEPLYAFFQTIRGMIHTRGHSLFHTLCDLHQGVRWVWRRGRSSKLIKASMSVAKIFLFLNKSTYLLHFVFWWGNLICCDVVLASGGCCPRLCFLFCRHFGGMNSLSSNTVLVACNAVGVQGSSRSPKFDLFGSKRNRREMNW